MSDSSESSTKTTSNNDSSKKQISSLLVPPSNIDDNGQSNKNRKEDEQTNIDDSPPPALDVAASLLSSKKLKKKNEKKEDDDELFNADDYQVNLMSYDPRSSKKRPTRPKTINEKDHKNHKRKSRHGHSNIESVDALNEKPKRMFEFAQSLTLSRSILTANDSDSNDRESPLVGDNGESSLSQLYETLKPSEEEIQKIETLNTDPFPKEGEWRQEEGAKFPGCASFVQLMLYLTQIDTVNIDFQKIFLVTFPSFASPRQLLTAIFKRYYAPIDNPENNINSNVPDSKTQKKMRMRIIRVLQFWINLVPYQFDDTMIETLNKFYDILQKEYKREDKGKQNPVLTILQERMKRLIEYKNNQVNKLNNNPRIVMDAPTGKGKTKWVTLMPDPNTLAEQVTLFHSEVFRNIGVMELLSAIWGTKKGGGSEHVDELTKHFDLMSRYVQFSIIAERDTPKERAELFLYWLEVGIRFFKDANYHGVFAIIYGLTHRSVQRMPQTMKSVEKLLKKKKKKDDYDRLVKLCDIAGNYREYRPLIEREIAGPIIPFIGCFQKDLIYAQEGFPNKIDGLVNFNKLIKCYELISIVEKYQNEKYKFERNEEFQKEICSFPDLPETTGMMLLSQEKEKKAK